MYKSIAMVHMESESMGRKNVASKQSFWQLHNWAKAPLGHRAHTPTTTTFVTHKFHAGGSNCIILHVASGCVCGGRSAVASSTSHLALIFLSIWLRDLWPLFIQTAHAQLV